MILRKITLFLVAGPILLQGCSTMTKEQCSQSQADWNKMGFDDSQYDMFNVDSRQKACLDHSVNINRENYLTGYQNGLKKYCTDSHFFFNGELGRVAQADKCPENQKAQLTKSYQEGTQLYKNRNRITELEKKISTDEKDKSFVADVGRTAQVLRGRYPGQDEHEEIAFLKAEIKKQEATSPDAVEYCEYEMDRKNKLQKIIPNFLINSSEDIKSQMSGCSRVIK